MDRRSPGDLKQLRRHLIGIDRHSGKTLWSVAIAARLPEIGYSRRIAEHGYASHTPVSDGKHVYVFFGKIGCAGEDAAVLPARKEGDSVAGIDARDVPSAPSARNSRVDRDAGPAEGTTCLKQIT